MKPTQAYAAPAAGHAANLFTASGVSLVHRSWLKRTIRLAQWDLTLEYSGRGARERIVVNGKEVVSALNLTTRWLHPKHIFSFEAGGARHEASIEVRSSWWPTISAFGLYVDGELIYADGLLTAIP
jgi:hypothetical protein